jgi:hypothetical protein
LIREPRAEAGDFEQPGSSFGLAFHAGHIPQQLGGVVFGEHIERNAAGPISRDEA